jgi:hypothetical protein
VSALYFSGNIEKARVHMQEYCYVMKMLGKSGFNRRFHQVADLPLALLSLLGETWKMLNGSSIFTIDSFPIAVFDNYQINRCHLYRGPV